MSGRYLNPPLVYMTALVKTTPLPALTSEQWANIDQALIKLKLPIALTSQGDEIQFSIPAVDEHNLTHQVRKIIRRGYFSANKQESLVLDSESIEWRTSAYQRYSILCERIEEVLAGLIAAADVFGYIPTKELALSYADVIAPRPDRQLSDYFSRGQSMLPLSLISGGEKDIQQVGLVQVTRVIEPQKKIFISLEQLPVVNKEIPRFIPQLMMEPDASFSMPLQVQAEWKDLHCRHYGLLTTQAAMLSTIDLKDFTAKEMFEPLHKITRETFGDLLNHQVCNADWKYMEDKGV